MFVLDRMLAEPATAGNRALMNALGPGFHRRLSGARQPVTALYWTLLLVALQRLAELAWAGRNTARLRRLGAIEVDAGGYPFFVLLHAGWLVCLALSVPANTRPLWPLLALFALLQLGRLWVILSLGQWWTTRILTLPSAPLVQNRPVSLAQTSQLPLVIGEIAVLPLAFGAVAVARIVLGAQPDAGSQTHSHRRPCAGAAPRAVNIVAAAPHRRGQDLDRVRRHGRRHVHGDPRHPDRRQLAARDPGRARHSASTS